MSLHKPHNTREIKKERKQRGGPVANEIRCGFSRFSYRDNPSHFQEEGTRAESHTSFRQASSDRRAALGRFLSAWFEMPSRPAATGTGLGAIVGESFAFGGNLAVRL